MNRIIRYFKMLEAKEATKFLIIFYIVGTVGFLIPQTRVIFEKLIPVSLIINIFMLLLFHKIYNAKHLIFFASIIIVTIAIEAIGVQTGQLFGAYIYGASIPVKVFGTPVLIGVNWLMLTYGAVFLIRSKKALRKLLPILVGLLMAGFDYVMEPVAMKTDMWTWMFNEVPLQNYVMWFVVATVIGGCYELFNINTDNKIAGRIFVLQLAFFGVLNIFLS
ncbi:MAG: carotenoid biosynthesis protein [Prolixibacteraceae bacterium]|jgi:putative membrane protein|nr:carotenoid biosynthesis protein [Prolixibacteraceae bacterium]